MTLLAENPVFVGTILDVESRIEQVLDQLKSVTSQTSPAEVLSIALAAKAAFGPHGFRARVQLEEDGRKKRSTADAVNFRFATGEIVIMFEAKAEPDMESFAAALGAGSDSSRDLSDATDAEENLSKISGALTSTAKSQGSSLHDPPALEIDEFCEALGKSEQDANSFVSVKRFRDLILPAYSFAWCKQPGGPQRVLNAALDAGRVVISKIPNPKNPSFPTSCISTNRTVQAKVLVSRFNPITVTGEPVSATLLRDRG